MSEHHHHNHNHEHSEENYLKIFVAVLFFCFGYIYRPLFIAAYLIAGFSVILSALKNIIKGQIFDENFLMSLATIGAISIQEYPEAAMVMILYQIGETLQEGAVDKSRDSIAKLMDIRPDYAVIEGKKVQPDDVQVGDVITVNTGEKIPLDGIVISGSASLDTSALTGEPTPLKVYEGVNVLSGTINMDGVLKIQVTQKYENSTVSKILELVEHAADKKTKTENFITKFARYYTPLVVLLSLVIAFVMPIFIQSENWFERALTFLVISCPCALIISVPLSFYAGIGKASSKGILIKGSNYLEQFSKASAVVFDKTGTLTKGCFAVKNVVSENPDLLRIAAYAESASSHPIAKAIRDAYEGEIPFVPNIQEFAGRGVLADVDGKQVKAGSADFVGVMPIKEYGVIVYISIDGEYSGYIVVADEIKTNSVSTISKLKKLKINTYMLTGDNEENANMIQAKLGLDGFYAKLLPADKVKYLEIIMQKTKGSVVFAGDGINDAPSIARADIGVAMGGLGSDAAIEAADVVIMDDKPSKLLAAIKISRKTMLIVKQNIIFAIGVKLLFLILGGFGLMTMWGAVFSDVGVTMIAVINALRIMK